MPLDDETIRSLCVAIETAGQKPDATPAEVIRAVLAAMPAASIHSLVADGFVYPFEPPVIDCSIGYHHDPQRPCWVRNQWGQKAHVEVICRTPTACRPRWEHILRVDEWMRSKPACPAKNSKGNPCGYTPWWFDVAAGTHGNPTPDHESFIWGRDDYCRYHNDHDPSARMATSPRR